MIRLAAFVAVICYSIGIYAQVGSITVYSQSGSTQTNRAVTLGRFFKQGDIPNYPKAVVAGTPVTTQADVKNRWSDGSWKFGMISFIVPSLTTAGVTVSFVDQATGNNSTGVLAVSDMLDSSYNFDGQIQLTGTASHNVSARDILSATGTNCSTGVNCVYWLKGPIVTAVILEDRTGRSFDVNTDGTGSCPVAGGSNCPLHPIFEAWFYPAVEGGAKGVSVGMTLENAWASSTTALSARHQTYSLVLTTGDTSPATKLTQASFTQMMATRWRREYWVGTAPHDISFNYNPAYLMTTTAYPQWDLNALGNLTDWADLEVTDYTTTTTTYPQRLNIPGYDNATGGGIVSVDQAIDSAGETIAGDWIGPFPSWDATYLLSGDPRLIPIVQNNADLISRFAFTWREADSNAGTGDFFDYPTTGTVDTKGRAVSINARKQATMNLINFNTACTGLGADSISLGSTISGNYGNWTLYQESHGPQMGYIPYTLFGKWFYYDLLEMQALFDINYRTGCYDLTNNYFRQGYLGLNIYSQERERAWALRNMTMAAFVAIDGDPEGPYITDKLGNMIALFEGNHNLTLDVAQVHGTDKTIAWNYGNTTSQNSQDANISPVGAWESFLCGVCPTYANSGLSDGTYSSPLYGAEAGWQDSFFNYSMGMMKQMGIIDTSQILAYMAIRPTNILRNPAVNHYLIQQYTYPMMLTSNTWVPDWATFNSKYANPPTGWGAQNSSALGYGQETRMALSFDVGVTTSEGYASWDAWNWYKANETLLPQRLSYTIIPFGVPQQAPTSLSPSAPCGNGIVGQAYTCTATVAGGYNPLTWTVMSGGLPPGLTLTWPSPYNGVISGTPISTGTYSPQLQVSDPLGDVGTVTPTIVISATTPGASTGNGAILSKGSSIR